ncbi:MAG: hypothetical protein WDN06_13170 [Asticcacaulis sp.]
MIASIGPETLGLLFFLGMRHGLDPDHIAVIDNITFRALEDRPKAAAWTGFLSRRAIRFRYWRSRPLFGMLGQMIRFPPQFETGMSIFIIVLLLAVGTFNLRALLSKGPYVPKGWRHGFMPGVLRGSTHPMITLAVGAVFGLVIDNRRPDRGLGNRGLRIGRRRKRRYSRIVLRRRHDPDRQPRQCPW